MKIKYRYEIEKKKDDNGESYYGLSLRDLNYSLLDFYDISREKYIYLKTHYKLLKINTEEGIFGAAPIKHRRRKENRKFRNAVKMKARSWQKLFEKE